MNGLYHPPIYLCRNFVRILDEKFAKYSPEQRDALRDVITIAFDLWKKEHGERARLRPPGLAGLLNLVEYSEEEFENLEPWHCVGPSVTTRCDLGIKLWLDKYDPFTKIIEAFELDFVLAELAFQDLEAACPPSSTESDANRAGYLNVDSLVNVLGMLYELELIKPTISVNVVSKIMSQQAKRLASSFGKRGSDARWQEQRKLVDQAVDVADSEWAQGSPLDHAHMKKWLVEDYSPDGCNLPFLDLSPNALNDALRELCRKKYPNRIRGVKKK